MIGRLLRTYGGSPDSWLRVPMGLLRGLADVAEKLEAEARLDLAAVIAAGSGQMSKSEHQKWVRDLARKADQLATNIRSISDFASHGFEVVEEPVV